MTDYNLLTGQPVRSLQVFLRQIYNDRDDAFTIIPDGIYGENTTNAVAAFQIREGLPHTGKTDMDTWNLLRGEYLRLVSDRGEPEKAAVYPGTDYVFAKGESSICLIPIQAIMYVLSLVYPELGTIEINGVFDEATSGMTARLQGIFGQEQTGILDKELWDMTADMYANLVTRNRFYTGADAYGSGA